jgi:hypothetical protein
LLPTTTSTKDDEPGNFTNVNLAKSSSFGGQGGEFLSGWGRKLCGFGVKVVELAGNEQRKFVVEV